jgi:hypothetical protein
MAGRPRLSPKYTIRQGKRGTVSSVPPLPVCVELKQVLRGVERPRRTGQAKGQNRIPFARAGIQKLLGAFRPGGAVNSPCVMGVAVVGSTTGPPGITRFSPPAPSQGINLPCAVVGGPFAERPHSRPYHPA